MPACVLAAVCGDHGLALDCASEAAAPAAPPGMTAALTGRAIDCTVVAPAVAWPAIRCNPSRWTPAKWAILMATQGARPARARIRMPVTV